MIKNIDYIDVKVKAFTKMHKQYKSLLGTNKLGFFSYYNIKPGWLYNNLQDGKRYRLEYKSDSLELSHYYKSTPCYTISNVANIIEL